MISPRAKKFFREMAMSAARIVYHGFGCTSPQLSSGPLGCAKGTQHMRSQFIKEVLMFSANRAKKQIRIAIMLIVILVCSFPIHAQQLTQRYNNILDRTEFYDSSGNLVEYAIENKILDQLEYYTADGILLKTERRNHILDRNETYDPSGNQQGYTQYNNILKQKETYDNVGNEKYVKRWNQILQRYDVFDPSGKLIGYYQYNKTLDQWEYFPND